MANNKAPQANDVVYVLDKKNKGPYECTILQVNDAEEKVLVHWTGCGKKSDEWVLIDRIVATPNLRSKDPGVIQALSDLSKIDPAVDKIIQSYNPDKSIEVNETMLYK